MSCMTVYKLQGKMRQYWVIDTLFRSCSRLLCTSTRENVRPALLDTIQNEVFKIHLGGVSASLMAAVVMQACIVKDTALRLHLQRLQLPAAMARHKAPTPCRHR